MALESGSYEGPFSFASRFENGDGSNPEELIAAAHAGCFSMAFSNVLAEAGHAPTSVETTADVTLEMLDDDGPTITTIHLQTEATVPGIEADTFQELAEAAKTGCPVSKALAGPEVTLTATLSA
jgi:osmotically inducible protein OsmC